MKSPLLAFIALLFSVTISAQTPNANAGADTLFCGHSGNLQAIHTEGTGTWTSTLPTHVTISDPSDPESEVYCDILTTGNPTYPYINFIWTVTLGEESDSDTVRVIFARVPISEIDMIPPKCFGEPATIAAAEDSLQQYSWNFYSGIIDSIVPANASGGLFEYFVHWNGEDTAHTISLVATNFWGCQSPINIDTVCEPIIPTFDVSLIHDTCSLGKGGIVFGDTLGNSAFFWIDPNVGPEPGPFTTVYNLPAGEYGVQTSYLTPNIFYYAYYINTFGTCNCTDTLHYEIVPDMVPEAVASVSMDVQLNNLFVPASVVFVNQSEESEFETTCYWNYGDGEFEAICDQLVEHIYNTTGCFSPYLIIEVPSIEGCRDTAFIEPCLNIQSDGNVNQNELNKDIKIFPNPASDWLKIETEKYIITSVRIIDILGKDVIKINDFENEKIYIGNLPNGVYRILIIGDDFETNLAFVIK